MTVSALPRPCDAARLLLVNAGPRQQHCEMYLLFWEVNQLRPLTSYIVYAAVDPKEGSVCLRACTIE